MSGDLRLVNRQRTRKLDLRRLREIVHSLLKDLVQVPQFDITIQFVGDLVMAQLNQKHLGHEGSTDVITLDYLERGRTHGGAPETTDSSRLHLVGEIVVCVDEALLQARRYNVPWTTEMIRYIVHGILHLCGHDDRAPAARKRMKLAENRLLRQLARRFSLSAVAGKPKLSL
jgi:probable rRNA maturation factor